MDKKFMLLREEPAFHSDIAIYRILALRSFGTVKAGDKGGYIQNEVNLSDEGDCWVHPGAIVAGNARIEGSTQLYDGVTLDASVKLERTSDYVLFRCKYPVFICKGLITVGCKYFYSWGDFKKELKKEYNNPFSRVSGIRMSQEDLVYLFNQVRLYKWLFLEGERK